MSDDNPPVRLVLLWHFHQPEYTDTETGTPMMPWTRLHALKDYADMAEYLRRHPGVRATINVVPSLIDQLRAIGEDGAHPDPFLAVARRRTSDLTAEDRRFIVSHFFSFNRDTLARGLRRLQELGALRGDHDLESVPQDVVNRFDDAALLDLQVLFHVAWSGPLLQAEPLLKGLREKQRHYTEEDKNALLDLQQSFLGDVVPRWRRLAEGGSVEFSTSPYFHPILPLLCDLRSAQEALPGLRLPAIDFAHLEDVDVQLNEAMRSFERTFGRAAAGGWPSEGSISESSLARMAAAGYRWAASDEDVLFRSLGETLPPDRQEAEKRRAAILYRPWRHGEGPVLLFRDHELSDRIGFVYSSWAAAAAAEDFLGRLRRLRDELPPAEGPYTVSVILDGENAWEYYPDNANEFFESIYQGLEDDRSIETLCASEAADPRTASAMPRVVAGSWIGNNLATWVGHPEKNRAWELLAHTREAIARERGQPRLDDAAWRNVLAAEGSDWFWWFGDDHPTPFAHEFDAAFRRTLSVSWRAAGLEPPAALGEPIRRGRALGFTLPAGPVRAVLDGRVTDYFEWLPAGNARATSGAMQSSARLVRQLRFGSDGEKLFLLLDPHEPPATTTLAGTTLIVHVPGEMERTLRVLLPPNGVSSAGPLKVAVDRVVEAEIPLGALAGTGEKVTFQVEIVTESGLVQRIPSDGSLYLPAAEEDAARFDWYV